MHIGRKSGGKIPRVFGGCDSLSLLSSFADGFQFIRKQKWLPENDPLTCLYPEKWVVGERQDLYRKADLHRLVFTFRRGTWKKLFFKLYCTDVDAHVTQVVDATQDNSDPIQLNVECSWTIFAKHPESCEVLKLAYATDNNFSNTVTFPRPRTGTRIGILVGFGASGLLSLVLLILFVKMHRKKQGMVLWVTNVTWAEHFQLFEDLFKRINDLSVFENKNLLELMKKTSQNLEMELRKCRAVVLVVGPRHFPELEDWWKEAYPQVLRYLVLEKYAKKLVIVKPSYFEEQIQMRGRHTVIYNGKNLEDVAEAIVGEDFALLEMIGARSYSTLWVAQKTSAFVKAEIRVLKYKAKFDASQLQLVHQQDDY
ncbi:unnamed protein product [Notodromas monacha]|uniref:Uncharacterized protein n=1 Tax=Notodromas monacha TaxID=399045 RepID=A0A7R9GDH3_9CRUS|nr:unnamed protein product [Notodromas monacha]CAG0916966.1 unnamed protein product [Notodromas monacha]